MGSGSGMKRKLGGKEVRSRSSIEADPKTGSQVGLSTSCSKPANETPWRFSALDDQRVREDDGISSMKMLLQEPSLPILIDQYL